MIFEDIFQLKVKNYDFAYAPRYKQFGGYIKI